MKTRATVAAALAAAALAAAGCAGEEELVEGEIEQAGEPPAEAPPPPDVELMRQEGLVDEVFEGDGGNLDELAYTVAQLEGENMGDRRGWSGVYYSPYATVGNWHVRTMFADGEIGAWIWVPSAGQHHLSIGAQGSWCTRGWPVMTTYVYDQVRGWFYGTGSHGITSQLAYDGPRYFPYYVGSTWMNAGWNWVSVVMSNDSYVAGYCDANLTVDYVNVWRY